MPRGRTPKPTNLKIVTGTARADRLNADEPRPDPTPPKCPSWLDAEAKRVWRKLQPELTRIGVLTSADGEAFAGYCVAWSEFRAATEILRAEGRIVLAGGTPIETEETMTVEENGKTATTTRTVVHVVGARRVPHPAVAQQRSAMRLIREYSSLFGLDPSSRSRIKAAPVEAVDELKAFAEGRV